MEIYGDDIEHDFKPITGKINAFAGDLSLPTTSIPQILPPFVPLLATDNPPNTAAFEPIRVLFIAQRASHFAAIQNVFLAMQNDARFLPHILLTEAVYLHAPSAVLLDEMREYLLQNNVPFFNAAYFNLSLFKAHLVCVSDPFEHTRPPHLQASSLAQMGARLLYLPAEFDVFFDAQSVKWRFDSPTARRAWRIVAYSCVTQKMYAQYCASGSAHVFIAPPPFLDAVNCSALPNNASKENKEQKALNDKINKRTVFLWMPSFLTQHAAEHHSTLQLFGDFLRGYLGRQEDAFLLIRPHPFFFETLRQQSLWTEEEISAWKNQIAASPNMALDYSFDAQASFLLSDALITDADSSLIAYLVTQKPLLYCRKKDALPLLPELEEFSKSLAQATNTAEIAAFVQRVLKDQKEKANANNDLLEQAKKLGLYESDLAQNGSQQICAALSLAMQEEGQTLCVARSTLGSHEIFEQQTTSFWQNAAYSELAAPDFYTKKAQFLEALLNELPPIQSALDIGCSNGRFTEQIARIAKEVHGCDVSKTLLQQAAQSAKDKNLSNMSFSEDDVQNLAFAKEFDLVACMGVTSTIPSELVFAHLLLKLKMLTKKGGFLLLSDSLSLGDEFSVLTEGNHLATYRNHIDYVTLMYQTGFRFKKVHVLSESQESGIRNALFLFQHDSMNPAEK